MPKRFSYSQEEVDNFLDELEEIIPVTATAWERVAELHLSRYPDQKRNVDSLKRKFKELHNKKVPTGDPLCPPAVRRAKRIRYLIIDKMDASDLNEYNSDVGEDGTGEGEDDRSGDELASFLVRGGSVGSTGDLGLDDEDNVNEEEEGRRSERSEGAGELARQSEASEASVYSWPSLSRASSVTGPSSRLSDAGSRNSSTRRRPQTHMTPISRPRTRQRGNSTPDSSPSDRIGNMIAMMMMNQASERDERRSEREERREEFRLQMEMQRQQMQQQQNMMTILLMNAMGGGGGANNQNQPGVQQLGMQQGHGGEEGKTGGGD